MARKKKNPADLRWNPIINIEASVLHPSVMQPGSSGSMDTSCLPTGLQKVQPEPLAAYSNCYAHPYVDSNNVTHFGEVMVARTGYMGGSSVTTGKVNVWELAAGPDGGYSYQGPLDRPDGHWCNLDAIPFDRQFNQAPQLRRYCFSHTPGLEEWRLE